MAHLTDTELDWIIARHREYVPTTAYSYPFSSSKRQSVELASSILAALEELKDRRRKDKVEGRIR